MKTLSRWMLALALVLSSALLQSNADPVNARAVSVDNSISLLPNSDVVVVLDVNRLMNDLLPKAKQAWPEQMAQFEKGMAEFVSEAAQDGVDIYKVKSLAIGLKMFGDKVTGAMIIDGLTVTPEMIAREKKDSKVVEYKGKTLYVELPKPEAKPTTKTPAKRAGAKTSTARTKSVARSKTKSAKTSTAAPGGLPVGEVSGLANNLGTGFLKDKTAMVQLDEGRMALGDELEVKAIIDALTGSPTAAGNISSELSSALQETRTNGVLRFAVNIPDSARQAALREEFLKNLAVTRMVLGTLDISDDMSLSLDAKLRTGSADDATKLHESLAALLGLGKMMLGGNQDPTMVMLNKLLDQIRISPQTNDVTLALTIPRELYETFIKTALPNTPAKSNK
ncbi:MAG TPA: hypothetical protein VFZ34_18150 [Blastocatellia bacterium]|nr:hypothetical protein [Blastocatellia bacterium]